MTHGTSRNMQMNVRQLRRQHSGLTRVNILTLGHDTSRSYSPLRIICVLSHGDRATVTHDTRSLQLKNNTHTRHVSTQQQNWHNTFMSFSLIQLLLQFTCTYIHTDINTNTGLMVIFYMKLGWPAAHWSSGVMCIICVHPDALREWHQQVDWLNGPSSCLHPPTDWLTSSLTQHMALTHH